MKVLFLHVYVSRTDPAETFNLGVRAGRALSAGQADVVTGAAPAPRTLPAGVVGWRLGGRPWRFTGWEVAR